MHNIIHLNCSTTYQNGVDETKLALGFVHACELHYRSIMKICPAHSAFQYTISEALRRVVGG